MGKKRKSTGTTSLMEVDKMPVKNVTEITNNIIPENAVELSTNVMQTDLTNGKTNEVNANRNKVKAKRQHETVIKTETNVKVHVGKNGRIPLHMQDANMLARSLAAILKEKKIDVMGQIISTIGCQKALDLFNQTQDIEKNHGGLQRPDGQRRTAGGVFMFLFKEFTSTDDFNDFRNNRRKHVKALIREKKRKLENGLSSSLDLLDMSEEELKEIEMEPDSELEDGQIEEK